MRNRTLPPLIGGVLIVVCLAGVALWRVRAASRDGTAPEPPPAATHPTAAPSPPAAPASPPRAQPGPSSRESTALDEARLMAWLRALAEKDPASAAALAREGNRRFPQSADRAERTSILIHALAAMGQSMEARGEAERMVNDLPDSPWVREVERFTGAHRHRNVRINDAGVLEYHDAPNR